jgi:hypothetical protein
MSTKYARYVALAVLSAAITGQLHAQSDQGLESRVYGLGQPATVKDLPPGQLKRKLDQLSPKARSRALKWLQDFSFAEADVQTLDVDIQGGVFYADTLVVEQSEAQQSLSAPESEAAPVATLDAAFALHSRPGAPHKVFIDFDGHNISGTAWNNGGPATYYAKPFTLDSDPDTFNDAERGKIVDIWHRVSEDLAPFNIDVTTEEPASFNSHTGHVLVTHTLDELGINMPSNGGGGVAYVGVYGSSSYHTYYSPALVYYNQLASSETYISEASSHEFGHNLGLSHDGTSTGTEYYGGHGTGLVSWAPIMGNSYYNNVTQWSKGEYPDANRTQDDLAIIDGKLGYAGDDHGNSLAAATSLFVDAGGSAVSSNPEHDPHNILPENKGVINSSSDVDVFTFIAGSGTVNLAVTPAWDAFYRATSRRGANLDVDIELRDVNNTLIAANDPINDTTASINVSVAPGAYYLLVTGEGNSLTPYSQYDSIGQYFINGSVPVATADNTAPTPDPMSFASAPAAISDSAISMSAVVATDDISAVQYNFRCTQGGQGCQASGWQSGTAHTASGLAAETLYTYVVEARDQSGNTTLSSGSASATTDAPPPPPPYVDYVSTSETLMAGTVSGTHAATHSNDGSAENITERESGGKKSNRYSYLEHRWNFNVSSGAQVTVVAQAWRSGSNGSESFDLEYSLNGGSSFSYLMNISSTSSANEQSADIPGAPAGSIILRVNDKYRSSANQSLSSFNVDHLYIRVNNTPGEPPPANPPATPTGMTVTAVTSSTINLAWVDESGDESGFTVERSPDGETNWVVIADLGEGMEAHGDAGLEAATQYFYRVSAWNGNGSEGYASTDAWTDGSEPPPPPALSHTARGYKDRGKHGVVVDWEGADTVDVYRDGSKVGSGATGGSYDDFIGNKGGATYEHQVCEAGGTTNCSDVTTTVF